LIRRGQRVEAVVVAEMRETKRERDEREIGRKKEKEKKKKKGRERGLRAKYREKIIKRHARDALTVRVNNSD
jgi:hypothetical protein